MRGSPEDCLERCAGPGRCTAPGPSGVDRRGLAPGSRGGTGRRGTLLAPATIAMLALLISVTLTTTGGAARHIVFPASPPPAHTGGFGEPTCHACHFEAPLNEPGGTLTLTGLPTAYLPGESYTLTAALTRPGMNSAGFQLAARFATGPRAGTQAGTLRPLDDRSTLTIDGQPGVEYLHHTETGAGLQGPNSVHWTFEWIAPVEALPDGSGAVVFHLVANAADGDASPFGDLIYTNVQEIPRGSPGSSRR